MEPFEIELAGELLSVQPQENGTYKIYAGLNFLGTLEASISDDLSVSWSTADLMSLNYAQQIGELIEDKEM